MGKTITTPPNKFISTPMEVAIAAIFDAMAIATQRIETGIKTCGDLAADKSTQSAVNKEYFADQACVYKEALGCIQKLRNELALKRQSED